MIELGLAFLVYLAPMFALGLLVVALTGEGWFGARRRRLPPLAASYTETRGSAALPILASDRERDTALESISYAVGEGRLSLDDAEPRIGAVLHSRHRHELADLVSDLPAPPPSERSGRSERSEREATRGPARFGLVALAAVALVAAVAVQAASGVWELWPVAVAAIAPLAFRPRR